MSAATITALYLLGVMWFVAVIVALIATTVQAALALALQFAPAVGPHMIVAIGHRESALDPLTIHDNTTPNGK